jgi:hypothetical protein
MRFVPGVGEKLDPPDARMKTHLGAVKEVHLPMTNSILQKE